MATKLNVKMGIGAVILLLLQLSGALSQTPAESSISGRVTGPAGQPLVGLQVRLMRPEPDFKARKILWRSIATVSTNDRGEYRHFGIAPGRYYIASGSITPGMSPESAAAISRRPQAESVSKENSRYETSFYPGTPDSLKAKPIDVTAGSEFRGIDLVLPVLRTFTIRGRFLSDGSALPANARITATSGLSHRDPQLWQTATGGGSRIAANPQNEFQIVDVPAGRYWVSVTLGVIIGTPPEPPPSGPRTTPPTAEENEARRRELENFLASPALRMLHGVAAVDVVDSDIDGVVILCKLAAAIEGRIAVEDLEWASLREKDRIRVAIAAPIYGLQQAGGAPPMPPTEFQPGGTFRFPMVFPGEDYRLAVTGLPDDVYVKSVRFGPNDVLGKPFSVSGPINDSFQVLLGPKGGRIDGTVLRGEREAVADAAVVLVPEAQLSRIDLYQTATVNASGHFTLRGIAPGAYTLFAFQNSADSYKALDRAFVSSPGSAGIVARIAEGDTLSIDLRVANRN